MNADGTQPKVLTQGASASWSPDGSRLVVGCFLGAFVGPLEFTDCGERGIFVIGSDGSGRTRIGDGFGPAWSPDGLRVAYASGQEGRSVQIHLMDLESFEVVRLTDPVDGRLDRNPCWAPDGTTIVFYSKDVPTTYQEIHAVDVNGRGRARLSAGRSPACSP